MKSNRKRTLAAKIMVVVFATVALTVWLMNRAPMENPFPRLPNPNGYAALLQGAKQLRGDPPAGPKATPIAIQQYLDNNRAIVEASRHALTLPSAVPVQFSPTYTSIDNIRHFKTLSQSFHLFAEAALAATNANAAISYWTDTVLLGQKSAAGGLAVDAIAAAAWQRSALRHLRSQFAALNEPQLRKVVMTLDTAIRQEEAPEQILLREKEWAARTHGLLLRLGASVRILTLKIQGVPDPASRIRKALHEKDAMLRLTLLDAAIHLHKKQNSSLPESLDDLQTYLPLIPPDPFSGRNFVYRVKGESYQLYSVGPDGVDDGGKLYSHQAKESIPQGDFALDMEEN